MEVPRRSRLGLFLVAALSASIVTLAVAPAASGATLYSNLGNENGSYEINQTTQRYAQPFVATASGVPASVAFFGVSYLNNSASVSVSIYTNANGGQPGDLIAQGAQATIDDTSDTEPACPALTPVLQSGQPVPLEAGQTYWAIFRNHTANTVFLSSSSVGASPRFSNNSGGTWAAPSGQALSLRVNDTGCTPDINSTPNPSPDPNAELGDMYAKPTGTAFQTLFVSNNGIAKLNLTGGSFTGPDSGIFKLLDGEPEGVPPGSPFAFPKTIGPGTGGVFLYIVCAPPSYYDDDLYRATFTLTSNDPDEGSISWPVSCVVDSTPPSLEFIKSPDGREDWFVTRPAPLQIRGVDPATGNRVKRIFCDDNGAPTLDWPNGSFASFGITPDGIHDLSCQGTDAANNTSAPGAFTTTVKVDGTPPETAIGDVGPPAISDEPAFSASFTGSDATSGLGEFECSLDGGPYELCMSPASRSGLGNGTHTFDVRARDVAGNYDPTPARWTWEVNAPAPQAADDAATSSGGAAVDIDVLANDLEPRGVPLHILLDSATSEMGGAVSVAGSRVQYIPPVGFAGTDRFSYRAVNANGVTSAAATVTVEVVGNSRARTACTVPKVKRGKSLRVAKRKLAAAGCTLGKVRRKYSDTVAAGKVIKLKKKAGKVLQLDAPVGIVLSKGPR